MRRISAILFVAVMTLAVTALPARAQFLPSFGITGGLNFTGLSDAATANLDQATGYHIGAFTSFDVGPIGLKASVLYVRAGDLGFPAGIPIFGNDKASATFIAVPLDLKYGAGTPLVSPYGLIGPEFRFPIGDLADADARNVALALNLGVGADFGFFIGPSVFAELRYALDMTGFFEDGVGNLPASQDESVRMNMFYLRIGIGL